jgi:tetratricopeptide (TPR) repeat protein
VINLELYFEHRNYPATAFLFLPVVAWLYHKATPRTFAIASLAVVLLLSSFTRYSATVWASLPSMIESSALKAPTSARAQSQYAKLQFITGRQSEAIETIERAIENIPNDDPLLLLNRLYFLCSENKLEVSEYDRVAKSLSQLPFDSRALKAYNQFAQEIVNGSCPGIDKERLESLFLQMLHVPRNGDPASLEYSHIQFLIGYTRVFQGKPQGALEAFEKSLDSRPGSSHAMAMAALLASRNFHREALVLADRALVLLQEELVEDPLLAHKVNESDILAFQEGVSAELAARQGVDTSDPEQ